MSSNKWQIDSDQCTNNKQFELCEALMWGKFASVFSLIAGISLYVMQIHVWLISWFHEKKSHSVLKSTVFWSSGKMTDCYAKPFKVSNPHYFMLLTTSIMEIPVPVHYNSSVCDIRWLQPDFLVDIIPSAPLRMPGCWLKRATGQNFCLKCQRQESARDQSVPRVTCAHKNTL